MKVIDGFLKVVSAVAWPEMVITDTGGIKRRVHMLNGWRGRAEAHPPERVSTLSAMLAMCSGNSSESVHTV